MDSMLSLDNFKIVFLFLLEMVEDDYFSNKVDHNISIDDDQSIYYKRMVRYVKEFHDMRRKLCEQLMSSLSCFEFGMELMNARDVNVYHHIPVNGVQCYIDKKPIQEGITMIIGGKNMFCISKRYEKLIYNLFLLMHLPDEIQKEYKEYKDTTYNASVNTFVEACHQRRLKFYYIKFKTIINYIESNI